MKSRTLLIACLLLSALSFAQEKKADKPKYNQELATSLGADKYGMKPYTIVMLTTGTAKIEDKAKMGEFANKPFLKICVWIISIIIIVLNLYLLYQTFTGE